MKPMLTRLASLAAAMTIIVGTLAGTAVAQDSPAPPPVDDGEKLTFTVGTVGDLTSANPFKACCGEDYEFMFINYDMLFNFDPADLSAANALAESYTVSEDGKTWTFKIRDDVTWSDGEPLTAADIAFTYNFTMDQDGTGVFRSELGVPKTFSAPDPTTLVWEMEVPNEAPLAPPWVPILPEHIWSKLEGKPASEIKSFRNVPAVGSGPFHLVEWKPGEFWRYEVNKDYWGGAPTIDELIFRVFSNQEGMVQALKSGEIDAAEALTPALFNSLKTDPNVETVETNENYFYHIAFNLKQGKNASATYGDATSTSHPALQDPIVRQAIAHATDKQTLVDQILLGYGSTADSFIMPLYDKYYLPAEGDEVYDFNIEKANQMLDEAGYLDTDGDGVREMPDGGESFKFDLVVLTDDPYSADIGQLVEGWLEQIGWDVNVRPVTESKAYEVWGLSDFDAYVWGWGGAPDPDFMTSIYTTDSCGVWSDGCYSNPEYDRLYEEQRAAQTVKERSEIVGEMQKIFYEDVPGVLTFYVNDLQAYRKDRWTGFVPQPAPDGSVIYGWGPYSYQSMTPVAAADGTTSSSSGSGGVPAIVWGAIAVGVIVLIGVWIGVSRRKNDEDQA